MSPKRFTQSSHPLNSIPTSSSVYVAGHRGLVGSAILRQLRARGHENLLTATHEELDLRDAQAVGKWFETNKPEYIFLVAGKVGGILANSTRPAEFLYDNLLIATSVLHASYLYKTKKVLYLGSSCIYPKLCPQPIKEESILSGPLETTNDAYALAKIAGIKMCQAYRKQYECQFISAMPCNLYGPGDNFDLQSSHVLPALIRKFHEAKEAGAKDVTVWGTGSPMREFLYVDDLADACCFLMDKYDDSLPLNVGTGEDGTIRELAELIGSIVYPEAELVWDESKPDGTPRKLLDVSRLHKLGWKHSTSLKNGIQQTYDWYLQHIN